MSWISMWRGPSTYFSTYTSGTPKAAAASAWAARKAWASSAGPRTMRIPRPPPPAEALRITGNPISRAVRTAFSSSSRTPGDPGSTGTPALIIAFLARLLSPISRMAWGPGPMNLMWQASQISAR
jgi:hypothetical protein